MYNYVFNNNYILFLIRKVCVCGCCLWKQLVICYHTGRPGKCMYTKLSLTVSLFVSILFPNPNPCLFPSSCPSIHSSLLTLFSPSITLLFPFSSFFCSILPPFPSSVSLYIYCPPPPTPHPFFFLQSFISSSSTHRFLP